MGRNLYLGIDLQEGFLNDDIVRLGYIKRVEDFLHGLPKDQITLSRFVNEPDSGFVKFLDWPNMGRDDPSIKLIGSLGSAGYHTVDKPYYTAWTDEVRQRAKDLAVDTVVLFGLDSDACVLKTALDIFEDSLRPVVLTDLCQSSGGQERHERGLEILKILLDPKQLMPSAELGIQTSST